MNKLMANSLILLGLAAAIPASAQNAPPVPDTHSMRMHHDMRGKGEQRPFSRPTERIEARLAFLKAALKITAAQQPLWDNFAALQRKHAAEREQRMGERHARMAQQSGPHEHTRPTAIERMERAQQFHAVATRHTSEQLEVVKPLYAALSSEQKQIADELLARGRGGKSGGMMRDHQRRSM